jgi:hypothetical protein
MWSWPNRLPLRDEKSAITGPIGTKRFQMAGGVGANGASRIMGSFRSSTTPRMAGRARTDAPQQPGVRYTQAARAAAARRRGGAQGGRMKARLSGTAAIVTVLLASATAGAQEGIAGKISVAAEIGTESQLGGTFLQGADGTLIGKPATIESKRYKDVYAPDLRLQGLIGYGASNRIEVIVRGTYYKADATAVEVGSMNGNPVYAFFGQYEEWGVELGLRYYLSARGRMKSYIAPIVGLRSLEQILADFSVPDAGSAVLNVPFNQASTVGVFGLDLGFDFALGPHAFIGVDTGLRYQGKPDPGQGLETLAPINASDGRWSAPVVVELGVRF